MVYTVNDMFSTKWYFGDVKLEIEISTQHEGNQVLTEKLIFHLDDDWVIMSTGHVKGSLRLTIPSRKKL